MNYSIESQQGRRPTMEDFHTVTSLSHGRYLFCLFDGHGGTEVSHLASTNIPIYVQTKCKKSNQLPTILVEAGVEFDKQLFNVKPTLIGTGTTSLLSVVTPQEVYIANCGDSRAILFDDNGTLLGNTIDHKPDATLEAHRIMEAGGIVFMNRVNGMIGVSRAFGDFGEGLKIKNKQYLGIKGPMTPLADSYTFPHRGYLLMACDGLWDVMTSEEVAKWVSERLPTNNLSDINRELIRMAIIEKGSTDNVTIMLIKL